MLFSYELLGHYQIQLNYYFQMIIASGSPIFLNSGIAISPQGNRFKMEIHIIIALSGSKETYSELRMTILDASQLFKNSKMSLEQSPCISPHVNSNINNHRVKY